MRASHSSVFSISLEALRGPSDSAALQERLEGEMRTLAERLLPVFISGPQVDTAVSADLGYRLYRREGCDLCAVDRAGRALSTASGLAVIVSGGDAPEICHAGAALGVQLPSALPSLSPRAQVARTLAQAIIDQNDGVCVSPVSVEDIFAIASRHGFSESSRVATTAFGGYELVIEGALSLTGVPSFRALVDELAGSHVVQRVVICPSENLIAAEVFRYLGSTVPWEMRTERDGESYTLSLDSSFRSKRAEVESLLADVSLRTGVQLAIEVRPLAGREYLLAPELPGSDEISMLMVNGADYLRGELLPAGRLSSVSTLRLPFVGELSPILCDFINSHIKTGAGFVAVTKGAVDARVSIAEYRAGVENLRSSLGLESLGITERGHRLQITLPRPADTPDFRQLGVLIALIQATADTCEVPVDIKREALAGQYFDFFARSIDDREEWSCVETSSAVELTVRQPTVLPAELPLLFRTLFSRDLVILRNPEPPAGIYQQAPTSAVELRTWSHMREILPSFSALLPPALGSDLITRYEGNRLTLYSQTVNLPQVFLERLNKELYGIPVPYVVRPDFQAAQISDMDRFRALLKDCLPSGLLLREISHDPLKGFRVTLSATDREVSLPAGLVQQLRACSAFDVEFVDQPLSGNLRALLERMEGRQSIEFLAESVDEHDYVRDSTMLTDMLFKHFHAGVRFPEPSRRVGRSYQITVEELFDLFCFSLDSRETRIHEDAFSVRTLGNGHREIGVHVVNGTVIIPYGCAIDVLARRVGGHSDLSLDGRQLLIPYLSSSTRALFDLRPGRTSETFSFTFEIDAGNRIVPDSRRLFLSRMKNSQLLTREDVESGESLGEAAAAMGALQDFVSGRQGRNGTDSRVSTRELVRVLIEMFNEYASETLLDAGVAVPSDPRGRRYAGGGKFTAPARDFVTLLAQRQLESVLAGRVPLSHDQVAEHLDLAGVAAENSPAYDFYLEIQRLRAAEPSARVRIASGGTLFLERSR